MKYTEIRKIINRINIYNALKEGECMNNYKFDNETTNKAMSLAQSNISNKNIDKLIKDIEKAKNVFNTADIPGYVSPNFEKMEMNNKSPDEIQAEAEKSLMDYKHSTLSKIEGDYQDKSNSIIFEKDKLKSSNEENKKSVEKYYSDAKQDASDDALKRGLSRSSIIVNKLDAFDKDELNTYIALDKELSDNINALDFELNTLTMQKDRAIADFDVAYAVKLSDKINKLNEELIKEQNEVLKYNNEIVDKEKKYLDNYNELVSDIQNKNLDKNVDVFELVSKYGKQAVENYKKNMLYEALDNFFAGVDKDEVFAIISENENIKEVLGDNLKEVLDRYK